MVQFPPLDVTVPVTPPMVVVPLMVPTGATVPETGRSPFGCATPTADVATSATSTPKKERYLILSLRMRLPPYRCSDNGCLLVFAHFSPLQIERRTAPGRVCPRTRVTRIHSGSGTRDAVPPHGTRVRRAGGGR